MKMCLLGCAMLLMASACSDSPSFKRGYDDGWGVGVADGSDGGPRNRDKAMQLAKKHAEGDEDYEKGYVKGYNEGYDKGKE